jgi:hypothetical protein
VSKKFWDTLPAEIAKLRERGQPVVDKFTQQIGADLVKQTRAQVEGVRAGKQGLVVLGWARTQGAPIA